MYCHIDLKSEHSEVAKTLGITAYIHPNTHEWLCVGTESEFCKTMLPGRTEYPSIVAIFVQIIYFAGSGVLCKAFSTLAGLICIQD